MLYQTEVKGIQSWILGSGTLREIAGGSEVIESLANLARQQAEACDGELILAAAGRAIIRFEALEHLERFARWWPIAVAQRAPGLLTVQAWADDDDWSAVQRQLAQARSTPAPSFPEVGPLLSRAGRTGLPAVERGRDGMWDRATKARVDNYREGRRRLADQLLPDASLDFAADDSELPEGYLAVVHADANGVGRLFAEGAIRLDNAKQFSDALAGVTQASAREALGGLRMHARNGILPVRPILLGGDDFTIIVEARQALPLMRRYLETFERLAAEERAKLVRPLTACAGVAIVKPGWPFSDGLELAEHLCRAAKARLRAEGRSGLAFHRVTTALADEWDVILEQTLTTTAPDGRKCSLTLNPYSLAELDLLDHLAAAVARLPRGALHRFVDLARTNYRAAQEQWERMRQVVRDRDAESRERPRALEQLDEALRELGCSPETGFGERGTPIFDALEWGHSRRTVGSA